MYSELQGQIRKVFEEDADYPATLFAIADRPPVLYVIGRWPLPKESLLIGVVGSRAATRDGLEAATRISTDLTRRGVITVSGLAKGIDAAAHRATLAEEGWTVAILGHGFGHQYPPCNKGLFSEIAKNGTLITEFSYSAEPLSEHFPRRNRIISGLSKGVVVVEAGERSGASITARYAAEQGRDVYAVPGSIFNWQSKGCHRLIKEGAKLVETGEDILQEYGLGTPAPMGQVAPETEMSPAEQVVFEHLKGPGFSVDELVELSGQSVDKLAEVLLSLELKGRIISMPGHRYVARS